MRFSARMANPTASIERHGPRLMLAQNADDLLLGEPASLHRPSPSRVADFTFTWRIFRGSDHRFCTTSRTGSPRCGPEPQQCPRGGQRHLPARLKFRVRACLTGRPSQAWPAGWFWCKSAVQICAYLMRCIVFRLGALRSRLRAQFGPEGRNVVARTAPCGYGASARSRRS